MVAYFNNCRGDDYSHYGGGAFYDLRTEGIQATQATDLSVGQECVVASQTKDGQVTFNWYTFQREAIILGKDGTSYRVFFGKHIKIETLSKQAAAQNNLYSIFFTKKGYFKRQSVIAKVGFIQ
jgi:hypothetical protein